MESTKEASSTRKQSRSQKEEESKLSKYLSNHRIKRTRKEIGDYFSDRKLPKQLVNALEDSGYTKKEIETRLGNVDLLAGRMFGDNEARKLYASVLKENINNKQMIERLTSYEVTEVAGGTLDENYVAGTSTGVMETTGYQYSPVVTVDSGTGATTFKNVMNLYQIIPNYENYTAYNATFDLK